MAKRLIRVYIEENNKDLIRWIESFKEISSGIVEILNKVRTGQLVEFATIETARELNAAIKQQQLENIKLRNEHLGYKIKIDKVRADYAEKFHAPPSSNADDAIKTRFANDRPTGYPAPKPNTMVQPDGTLRCVTCGTIIPLHAYNFEQADAYSNHVSRMHGRKLYPEEQRICLELANK